MLCLLCNSTIGNFLSIIIAFVCIVIAYFKYTYTYWDRLNVPNLPASIPFGNCRRQVLLKISSGELMREIYHKLKSSGKSYGGFYLFAKPMLILLDPELVKHVMTVDFNHFTARTIFSDEKNEPLSVHLLSLNGIKWRNLRTKLTPTFSSGKMKMMFSTLVECSNDLDEVLDKFVESQEAIDVKDLMGRFTTDIISSCAFGLECNSLKNPDNEFRRVGKRIFDISPTDALKVLFSNNFPKLYRRFGPSRLPKYISDFFTKIIYDLVKYREENNVSRNDFMQLLIQLKNRGTIEENVKDLEPGQRLTMKEVAGQAFVFYLAGFETSSSTMCFFMYDMAVNQHIQDKVREEINEVLKKHDGKITYESIAEMTYLDKVINESMRLHAIIPNLVRTCTKDYRIPNTDVVIKNGTPIIIPAYSFQTDPAYYPNPEVFDPERFSPEEKAKRHPYTFLPFGEGPRNCIGLRFGLLQTKVGLAALLKNHRYTLSPKTTTPIRLDPKCNIFTVLGGIWLTAERV